MSFTHILANKKIEISYLTRSCLRLHQQEIWVRDYTEYWIHNFFQYHSPFCWKWKIQTKPWSSMQVSSRFRNPLIMLGVILCTLHITRVFPCMKLFDRYQNVLATSDIGVYQDIVLPVAICQKKKKETEKYRCKAIIAVPAFTFHLDFFWQPYFYSSKVYFWDRFSRLHSNLRCIWFQLMDSC